MLKRNLILRLVSALAAASAIGLLPAFTYAAGSSAAITKPPAGMGSVVLINQDGGSETLSVNLGGTTYTVAPQGGSGSNQVEFNLAPGSYTYSASVPGISGINKSIDVVAGKVTSLSFQDNAAELANGDNDGDDVAQTTLITVVGNEADEHESKSSDRDKAADKKSGSKESSEQKDSGPDGDETHLVLGPSVVNDNDDILVTVGDLTSQAQ